MRVFMFLAESWTVPWDPTRNVNARNAPLTDIQTHATYTNIFTKNFTANVANGYYYIKKNDINDMSRWKQIRNWTHQQFVKIL